MDVQVKRRFKASAEKVFDAFLDPAKAGKFLFATPDGEMVRVEIDARIGGRFNFTDRRNGEDVEHVGEYIELDRPRRLVFDFRVPKYSAESTRVAIDITPHESGCELTLTHSGVYKEYVEQTREGWSGILERLAAVV
jgi:uncharacterized protein YndB with AHSA1/START domain